VRAEARELERAGHKVIVIAAPFGLTGGAFGWPGVAARLRERPTRALSAAWWVARTRAHVSRLKVARVVAHWAVPCAWPIGVASHGALEVVSHGGDVRLLQAMPSVIRLRIVRAIASRAVSWRFVSEPLLDCLLRAIDRDTRAHVQRIAVVRAAAIEMPDVHDAIARRRRWLGSARVAVSVGRLVVSKRVDRAIEHVAASADIDTLVIVGDGPERSRLNRLAQARGVDARFVGTLSRQESLAWIGAADLLIHASSVEGLSTVVREAEALGTPIVRLES
jgi:teichuronic acid biosynthesis glycosyltransferase TuaC